MEHRIVIIAKESSLWAHLTHHLRQHGFAVTVTTSEEEGTALLSGPGKRLVLLGIEGFKREGIAMLRSIRSRFPRIEVITVNAGDQLDLSIEAMRLGAFDDFLIPFDVDGLMACIHKALNKTSTRSRAERP
jgi:DNA-binding NtrC family response regulator